jgi:hypothetical protein
MDATRKRRTKDRARQAWYAGCRQRRFARFLGFFRTGPAPPAVSRELTGDGPPTVSEVLVTFLAGSRGAFRRGVGSELVRS